jgi:hypothetical protein
LLMFTITPGTTMTLRHICFEPLNLFYSNIKNFPSFLLDISRKFSIDVEQNFSLVSPFTSYQILFPV